VQNIAEEFNPVGRAQQRFRQTDRQTNRVSPAVLSYSLPRASVLSFIISWRRLYRLQCMINPLIATLKPQSSGPLYSNTVIGTLAGRRWVGCYIWYIEDRPGRAAPPVPPCCTKCNMQRTHQQPLYQLHTI